MSEIKLLRENGIYISYKKLSEELGLDPKTLYNWKNHAKKHRILSLIHKGLLYERLLDIAASWEQIQEQAKKARSEKHSAFKQAYNETRKLLDELYIEMGI